MDAAAQLVLLNRARQGDNQALGSLLQLFRPYVRVLARAARGPVCPDDGEDSDLIQNALVEAVRCFSTFDGTTLAELRGWLRTVTIRTVRRSRWPAPHAPQPGAIEALIDPHSGPSSDLQRQDLSARVAQTLAELPEEMQRVLIGRFVHGLDHAAIANQLGKSPGAVRKLFLRALERFREAYRE